MREVFKGDLFTNQNDILFHWNPFGCQPKISKTHVILWTRLLTHRSFMMCVCSICVCFLCMYVCATCLCLLAHWPVYFCNAKEHYCLVAADWVKHQSTGQKEPEALWARLASCLTTAHMSHTMFPPPTVPYSGIETHIFPYRIKRVW